MIKSGNNDSSVRVNIKTREILNDIKYYNNHKSIDETINDLIKFYYENKRVN